MVVFFSQQNHTYFTITFNNKRHIKIMEDRIVIEVKNLVKKYGSHVAVDHLNFSIEHGKIYGLLGPNGAGKSTTMNIMTGYIGPTEGDVIIDGHSIVDEPDEAKKHIGYLPEIPPLYVDMTVDEYLNFAAKLKKIPAAEIADNVAKAKETAQIADVSGRLIKNLSKGYRQRVGLAYAVLGFPEIIILDEPTVGLDPKQIIEIREVIKSLAKEHTVILSSHILQEISAVCDYIMIISHGKLVAADSIENLNEMMKDTNTLEILIKAPKENVEAFLGGMEGVRVTRCDAEEDFTRAAVEFGSNHEIVEQIFYGCAQNHLPVYEMNRSRRSLEDLFLEVTQDDHTQEGMPQKEEKKDEENREAEAE
jgi:ABC-2 type transport system ATP-binding protein